MTSIPRPYGPLDRPAWWKLPGPPPPFDAATARRAMEWAVYLFGGYPTPEQWARLIAVTHARFFEGFADATAEASDE